MIDSDVITRTENENFEDEEDTNVVLVGDDDDFIDEDIGSDADIQKESEYKCVIYCKDGCVYFC